MTKLSDFLINEIYSLTRTDKFFGYIGGMIAHIVDSIYLNEKVELINTITEQGAGFAAEGYARVNEKLGVAIATSGPGATNLVTPIANCYFDSTPVLFITGQVNTYEYQKYDIKQCGFQETNIVDIVRPITKYSKLVDKPQDIKFEIQKAIYIATSGRKGPVLLDIPMDIQRAEIDEESLKPFVPDITERNFSFDKTVIESAQKPLLLVGNGVNLSGAFSTVGKFLAKTQIPVVETLHGISSVNFDYKYNLGLMGTYGERYANLALYDCDLLIVLGSRLDIRQTGAKLKFMKNKTIVHVDIDEKELECPKFEKIKVNADIKEFVEYLNSLDIFLNIEKWQKKCIELKETFSHENKEYKKPNIVLDKIFDALKEDTKITFDVGQNQIWAAQSARIKKGQRTLASGGLGSMGFALPAAIGASFNGNKVIAITGDGGMQMNLQELEILKRRNLTVKIIVLNNKSLGMVKTFQSLYFDSRYASTFYDYSAPDFVKIASAYGIDAISVNSDEFDITQIREILDNDKPSLININFESDTQTEPRLQFGNSIENAHPLVDLAIIEKILK